MADEQVLLSEQHFRSVSSLTIYVHSLTKNFDSSPTNFLFLGCFVDWDCWDVYVASAVHLFRGVAAGVPDANSYWTRNHPSASRAAPHVVVHRLHLAHFCCEEGSRKSKGTIVFSLVVVCCSAV